MLDFMGGWLALPDPVVYRDTYDATWESLFDAAGSDWYNAWLMIWELSLVDVTIIPGLTLPGVAWNISAYLSFNLFKLTDDYACPKPCRYTSGIWTLPP